MSKIDIYIAVFLSTETFFLKEYNKKAEWFSLRIAFIARRDRAAIFIHCIL
jgi:hypothetical protein